jgi:hypothetical protein
MKYILPALLLTGVILFAACKQEPPISNLSSNFVVLTNYDTSTNFANYKTFAIRDTIAVNDGNPRDSLWYGPAADSIIEEFAGHMRAAGYTQVWPGQGVAPDLGIQLIGIRNTTVYIGPGYWNSFPGFVGPDYWGYPGGWPYYYPYYYYYSVSTGSLTMQMADLKSATKTNAVNVVWSGNGFGQIGSDTAFVVSQCLRSVDQAFAQSPYLQANSNSN